MGFCWCCQFVVVFFVFVCCYYVVVITLLLLLFVGLFFTEVGIFLIDGLLSRHGQFKHIKVTYIVNSESDILLVCDWLTLVLLCVDNKELQN